jgi:DNA sulfur modification protein DndD
MINHDAFMKKRVNAFVEVEIEMPTERNNMLYTIRREWTYNDKRLLETYTVLQDGIQLNNKDKDFFKIIFLQLFLQMFDFFFL